MNLEVYLKDFRELMTTVMSKIEKPVFSNIIDFKNLLQLRLYIARPYESLLHVSFCADSVVFYFRLVDIGTLKPNERRQ